MNPEAQNSLPPAGLRSYSGAVAIVTGGGSGIGRALAEGLARRGCEVVAADRNSEAAAGVAAHIAASGGQARAASLDVTDGEAVYQLVQDTVERTGRLDYLFNNAGVGFVGLVREDTFDDWRRMLDVNLWGVVHGVRAAYPVMERQGFGHIVNTASMVGLMPAPASIAYATSKHAVVGLSVSLRARGALDGIRVSALCPGFVDTPMIRSPGPDGDRPSDSTELAHILPRFLRPLSPQVYAEKALAAVARNQGVFVYPRGLRGFWRNYRLCPECAVRQASRRLRRMRSRFEAAEQGGSRE